MKPSRVIVVLAFCAIFAVFLGLVASCMKPTEQDAPVLGAVQQRSIEGTTADNAAFPDNPVVVAGVDENGAVQQLAVDTNGNLGVFVPSGLVLTVTVGTDVIDVDATGQGDVPEAVADNTHSVDTIVTDLRAWVLTLTP